MKSGQMTSFARSGRRGLCLIGGCSLAMVVGLNLGPLLPLSPVRRLLSQVILPSWWVPLQSRRYKDLLSPRAPTRGAGPVLQDRPGGERGGAGSCPR